MNRTVRPATPEDAEGIRACHREIEALMGCQLDLPAIDDKAILEYLVVEKDGKIIGGLYLEKVVHESHFGINPEATAELRKIHPDLMQATKRAGVRFVHCPIFRQLPEAEKIGAILQDSGFERRDDIIDYSYDLRG